MQSELDLTSSKVSRDKALKDIQEAEALLERKVFNAD